jgi:glutamyl-tRNA synthetase/nondiscriminating glutamyl-tRNA synthetase
MARAVHFSSTGGALTVESARLAFFLWLHARQQNAPFAAPPLDELRWLGLEPDAGASSGETPEWVKKLPAIEQSDPSPWGQWSGQTAVAELRELGVLPEALVNFLALQGWCSPQTGEKPQEIFSREELLKLWSPAAMDSAPLKFDFELLRRLNHHWLQQACLPDRQAGLDRLVDLSLPYYHRVGWLPDPLPPLVRGWLCDVICAVLPGLDFLSLLPPRTRLVFDYQPERYMLLPESRAALEREGARAVIRAFGLRALEDGWMTVERFRQILEEVKRETHMTGRNLVQPIRVMLTGLPFGPELDQLIPIIERGAELPLPVRVKSCRERVLAFCSIFS